MFADHVYTKHKIMRIMDKMKDKMISFLITTGTYGHSALQRSLLLGRDKIRKVKCLKIWPVLRRFKILGLISFF